MDKIVWLVLIVLLAVVGIHAGTWWWRWDHRGARVSDPWKSWKRLPLNRQTLSTATLTRNYIKAAANDRRIWGVGIEVFPEHEEIFVSGEKSMERTLCSIAQY